MLHSSMQASGFRNFSSQALLEERNKCRRFLSYGVLTITQTIRSYSVRRISRMIVVGNASTVWMCYLLREAGTG
jgi:hypothetical protein